MNLRNKREKSFLPEIVSWITGHHPETLHALAYKKYPLEALGDDILVDLIDDHDQPGHKDTQLTHFNILWSFTFSSTEIWIVQTLFYEAVS